MKEIYHIHYFILSQFHSECLLSLPDFQLSLLNEYYFFCHKEKGKRDKYTVPQTKSLLLKKLNQDLQTPQSHIQMNANSSKLISDYQRNRIREMEAVCPLLWMTVSMEISVTKHVTCTGVPKSIYFTYIFTWVKQSIELVSIPTYYLMKWTVTEFQ